MSQVRSDDYVNAAGTGAPAVSQGLAPAAAPSPPIPNVLYQEGVIRAWVGFNGLATGTLYDSFNVDSVADNGVGDYQPIWTTDFSDTNYAVYAMGMKSGNNQIVACGRFATTKAVGSHGIACRTASSGAAADPNFVYVMAIGAQ